MNPVIFLLSRNKIILGPKPENGFKKLQGKRWVIVRMNLASSLVTSGFYNQTRNEMSYNSNFK